MIGEPFSRERERESKARERERGGQLSEERGEIWEYIGRVRETAGIGDHPAHGVERRWGWGPVAGFGAASGVWV